MNVKENCIQLEVELESGLDAALLSDVEWFVLSGGTPRKERGSRRLTRSKSWNRVVDLCAWIGMKVRNYL